MRRIRALLLTALLPLAFVSCSQSAVPVAPDDPSNAVFLPLEVGRGPAAVPPPPPSAPCLPGAQYTLPACGSAAARPLKRCARCRAAAASRLVSTPTATKVQPRSR